MAGKRSPYQDMFESALAAEGVTGRMADLARSVNRQESGAGQNTATSNAGAQGGMQIIPSTFASVADKDWSIADPMQNARAGIRYLKQLDRQSGGDSALTAAGYYGGPGGMEKARRGIAVSDPRNPNAPNTLQYAQQVASRMGKENANVPVQVMAQAAPVPAVRLAQTDEPSPQYRPAPPVGLAMGAVFPAQEVVQPDAVQVAEAAPEWDAFQQAMPRQTLPMDLNFSRSAQPVATMQPNFNRFRAWGAKA